MNTAAMKYQVIYAIAAIVGLYLSGAQTALAGPMLYRGEQKVCISNCVKNTNPAGVSNCLAICHARLAVCRKTGCWDNGTNRYCGLMRQ
jgi:hypothetical protein